MSSLIPTLGLCGALGYFQTITILRALEIEGILVSTKSMKKALKEVIASAAIGVAAGVVTGNVIGYCIYKKK